jgi:hypothetical protein
VSQTDLAVFRRMCGQYRWLAIFMVISVGAVLALIHVIAPVTLLFRDSPPTGGPGLAASIIPGVPAAFYLFAVWSIGRAMGQIAGGRLFQPTVADALRRVGLALGIGGVFSVFIMSNLLRMIGEARGSYLYFDVPGMTLGMIGGALFLLGRVVDQARRVQTELDEMI